ncbi:DUF3822 family protein [Arcticibacter sp. MXS-1]|uniref:DUF3822 family protein n=1 Tax=Arcticibacter sp. MXS-1 TaxID=3341726 RepID=UPI0035A83E8B
MNYTGTLHLKVEGFNQTAAEECELLLRVSSGRLSYAVIHPETKSLKVLFDAVLLHSLPVSVSELIKQNEYLSYPFKKVKVSAESFHFTFIPSELYSREGLPAYKNFLSSSKPSFFVVNQLKQTGMQVIAALEEPVAAPFKSAFASPAFYSQAESLITGAALYPASRRTLFLHFNSATFETLVINGQEVIFYNIYASPTTDDFNYFLLLVIQQLDLKTGEVDVLLSGEIEKYSEHYRRISKYFSSVSFADSTRLFNYQDSFKLVPLHQFFSLLSLSLCE